MNDASVGRDVNMISYLLYLSYLFFPFNLRNTWRFCISAFEACLLELNGGIVAKEPLFCKSLQCVIKRIICEAMV